MRKTRQKCIFLKNIWVFGCFFFANFYIGKYKGRAETRKYPPNSQKLAFYYTTSVLVM